MADAHADKPVSPSFALLLFIFFFSVFSLTLEGLPTGGDALGMFLVTNTLVEDGSFFLADSSQVVLRHGRDGKLVSKYGIGQSLAEIPAYLVARIAAARTNTIDPAFLLFFITSFTSPLICAALCGLFFLMCLRIWGDFKTALALTFLLGLGTLVWPHSKTLFSEPLQTLCLAGGFYALIAYRESGGARRAFAAGFLLGLMAAAKPFLLLAAAPAAFYFLASLRSRPRGERRAAAFAAFAAPFAFWIAVILWYNWARFGGIFEFGYLGGADRDGVHGFSVPLLVGLHGLLFSSGKGLLFFVPSLILLVFAWMPFAKKRPALAWTVAATFVIMLFGYAKWNAWSGDFAWGPRFLLPAVPLLILPLGALFDRAGFSRRLAGRAVIGAAFLISFLVQILGVSVSASEYLIIANRASPYNGFFNPARVELRDNILSEHYIPEYSQLAGHYWLLKHIILNRGLSQGKLEAEMQKDFPWKGIASYAPPRGAAAAARLDTWWTRIGAFYPDAAGWTQKLALFFSIMLIISGAALARAINKLKDTCFHGDSASETR
ncbi:MAG: hypothetical protein WCX65_01825 [bacterium]